MSGVEVVGVEVGQLELGELGELGGGELAERLVAGGGGALVVSKAGFQVGCHQVNFEEGPPSILLKRGEVRISGRVGVLQRRPRKRPGLHAGPRPAGVFTPVQ